MSGPFIESLVNKTDPDPFHQLVVLSQAMINNAFTNLWKISDPDSQIKKFKMSIRGAGSIDSQLFAPRVVLHVSELLPQLYYLLQFQSGTMSLYESNDESNDDQKKFDMTGWVFAFPVSIKHVQLTEGSPDFDDYKKKMGDPQGVFSLAQLLLDASQAASWEPAFSSFGNTDWPKETPVLQANFATFVNRWLNLMTTSGKTVIGIVLDTKNPGSVNPYAPTFPPTSVDRYMYPWLDPSNRGTPVDGDDRNALCYLMMTGDANPPSPPVLNYSGTFVDGTSNYGGLLCMNTSQFWNSWLLPLLKDLNKITEIQVQEPTAEIFDDSDGQRKIRVGPRYLLGTNEKHTSPQDPYFDFKVDANGGWYWKGEQMYAEKSDAEGLNGWIWKIICTQTSNANTRVTFGSGGQRIAITGYSQYIFTAHETGFKSGPFKTESSFTIDTNWHLNFALGVVQDGGLQIARIPDPPNTEPCSSVGKSSNEGINWSINWESYTNGIADRIDSIFKSNLGSLENKLQDALANQHKLFLPASGTFLMRDALFSKRGDLLANLSYNGAPPPGQAISLPDYLHKLPKRRSRHLEVPIPKPTLVEGIVASWPGKPGPPPEMIKARAEDAKRGLVITAAA